MFGHKADPSCIYRYKARKPAENAALVDEQMRLAHRYANRLIEIERQRREQTDALLRERAPAIPAAEAQIADLTTAIEALETQVKRSNARARSRTADPETKGQLRELRQQRKEARARHKEARTAAFADETLKADLAAIDLTARDTARQARGESGVYWGTYLHVEQSLDLRTGPPPRFRPFRGDGTIAVQLQKGLPWVDALTCTDSRLRIELLPRVPGQPRTLARLHIRVGSEGRAPVWAIVPFFLHRHPPDGTLIKWVQLKRHRSGYSDQWCVCFVLARPEGWAKEDRADAGCAGVDLGWRVVPGGLRVAVAIGDDGQRHELILPESLMDEASKPDSLRAIRDRNFDAIRGRLLTWLGAEPDLPEWLPPRLKDLARWRSPFRLAAVVRSWRAARFAEDTDIFADLEAWRVQDRHLADWEAAQRAKVARKRDDLYRKYAARLRRAYRTVAQEDMNVRELLARPTPDEDDTARAARIYARLAAVGRLRQMTRETVADPQAAPAEFTTLRCHKCGHIDRFDAAAAIYHTCSECGAIWDQDDNASLNLLAWVREQREVAGVGPNP